MENIQTKKKPFHFTSFLAWTSLSNFLAHCDIPLKIKKNIIYFAKSVRIVLAEGQNDLASLYGSSQKGSYTISSRHRIYQGFKKKKEKEKRKKRVEEGCIICVE